MARARNIKPAFFDNDKLADNEPLGRLLFIGLWTIADHNGNLEWRPKRIKVKLLPYDECDVEKLATNLDKSGFVRFYSDGDKLYLNIPTFLDHQNPHKNEREKGTDIPEYSKAMRQAVDLKGLTINRDKSGLNPECSASDPAESLILNPESLILNPDSPSPDKSGAGADKLPTPAEQAIEYLNSVSGAKYQKKGKSLGHANARIDEGHTLDDLKLVVDAKWAEWRNDPKMAQYLRPETLFGASKFPGYLVAAKAKGGSAHTGFDNREYTDHIPDWENDDD